MTVNHGVPGSSPGEGARVHKATEMSPFSLSISGLGVLHLLVFRGLYFFKSYNSISLFLEVDFK